MDVSKMSQAELNKLFDDRLKVLEKDRPAKESAPKAVKEKKEG